MTALPPNPTSRPSRSSREKSDPAQFEYDGLFQFGHAKQQLTVQEVATALGTGEKQIFAYLDEGLLFAAPIGDQADSIRKHRRISRFSVLAFYYERLEGEGQPIPFRQTPETIWWRNQLRARRGLPPLTENPK